MKSISDNWVVRNLENALATWNEKLAELWHDPEVLAAVDRDSRGTSVPVNRPAAELEEILERAEKDARENPDAE